MKTNAKIDRTEQGLKVSKRANASITITSKGLKISTSKLTFAKLQRSVFFVEELLAA